MSQHLKRLAAPKSWCIERKTFKFTVKPLPGRHKISESMPLLCIIRDILKYCDTTKECKKILNSGAILLNGSVVKEYKLSIGLFDVLSIPKIEDYYLITFDARRKIKLNKITSENAKFRLVRIQNKTIVKNGKIQLNCHDGTNVLVSENKYHTKDTLKISIPEQSILEHYPFEIGSVAYITGGSQCSTIAKIKNYYIMRSSQKNIVEFEDFSTIEDYVFVVGKDAPVISLQ